MHIYVVTQTAGRQCQPTKYRDQTYIRRVKGAGGLRGISTNAEHVAVWVGSFSVCAHLDLAIEAMYCHEDVREKPFGGTEGNARQGTSMER